MTRNPVQLPRVVVGAINALAKVYVTLRHPIIAATPFVCRVRSLRHGMSWRDAKRWTGAMKRIDRALPRDEAQILRNYITATAAWTPIGMGGMAALMVYAAELAEDGATPREIKDRVDVYARQMHRARRAAKQPREKAS